MSAAKNPVASEEFANLTPANVDKDHFQVLEEVARKERLVAESVQEDNRRLREQLAMATERINRLDQTVHDQDETSAANEALFEEKTHLQGELQAAASYISNLEERCLDTNKQMLALLQNLRDQESENDTLKEYINELKHRIAVYVPINGDETDQKMAEFINNYKDRKSLKIMFLRESPGIYSFGSKQAVVSLMRNSLKIKAGAGFMDIEDYINSFLPTELAKLESKDPLKKVVERPNVRGNADLSRIESVSQVSRTSKGSPTKTRSNGSKAKLHKHSATINFDEFRRNQIEDF